MRLAKVVAAQLENAEVAHWRWSKLKLFFASGSQPSFKA